MQVERLEMLVRSYRKTEQYYHQEVRKLAEIHAQRKTQNSKLSAQNRVFQDLKKRLLVEGRDEKDQRAVFQNVQQLDKKLGRERKTIEEIRCGLKGICQQQSSALKKLAVSKKKLEKLDQLIQKEASEIKVKKESAVLEGVIESRLAADLAAELPAELSPVDKTDWQSELEADMFEVEPNSAASIESVEESVIQIEGQGATDSGGSNTQFFSGHGSREHSSPGSNSAQDSTVAAEQSQQSFSDAAEKQKERSDDFTDQILDVNNWQDSSGTGVALTYVTSQGKKLDLQISGGGKDSLKVEIAPENTRDRLSLWGEKHKIKTALEDAGLRVSQVVVAGSLNKKGGV